MSKELELLRSQHSLINRIAITLPHIVMALVFGSILFYLPSIDFVKHGAPNSLKIIIIIFMTLAFLSAEAGLIATQLHTRGKIK